MSCTLLFSSTTHRPRRHPGAAGGPGGRARHHGRRRRAAGRAGRRARHARRALGGRADARRRSARASGVSDDVVPAAILSGGQGGGLDAGVTAGSLADLHGDTIALGRRRAEAAHAEVGDRVRGHARRRDPHARHRRGDLHPRAGVRRRPARPRARGRPPDRPAARDDPREDRRPGRRRPAPARAGRPVSRAAGERPRLAGHRDRRRPRDEPLARPAVRRDHLRLHVDRRGQHADDDRAAARPRARAPAARRRDAAARCARWHAGRPA